MLDKTFRPGEVETRLYRMWEDSGAFQPTQKAETGNFSIVIPPPNVTGSAGSDCADAEPAAAHRTATPRTLKIMNRV